MIVLVSFAAGFLVVSAIQWRTWRDVVVELRDHGWRNDR